MGRLKANQAAFQKNVILDGTQAPKPVILPIFGKTFEGHEVVHPNPRKVQFDGEGWEGWGFHQDLTVDCINITRTRIWKIQDADSWENFMNMEILPEEVGLKEPAQAVISRLVITMTLIPPVVVFVPDPLEWAVYVNYAGVLTSGIYGTLCPRPVRDKASMDARMKLAKRRRSILENCI